LEALTYEQHVRFASREQTLNMRLGIADRSYLIFMAGLELKAAPGPTLRSRSI